MATRAILTHQPEVECDVCGRRLLRGERPDTFLASGHTRTVCELCVPRATHVGWMRASDAKQPGSSIARGRPGRSLIGRLRHLRNQTEGENEQVELDADPGRQERRRVTEDGSIYERAWTGGQPFDVEDDHDYSGAYAGATQGDVGGEGAEALGEGTPAFVDDESLDGDPFNGEPLGGELEPVAAVASAETTSALASFNVSECATRIAGIARALGEPIVNVRQLDVDSLKVVITVAWELCWYRYEVELRSDPVTIALISEGMELDELPAEDRVSNAAANERGELSLLL
ncbi:MAG TPA: hypothetical protein VGF95_08555 [Solirubrobacteraceae bacterium]|jgi:hypothetical protein